MSQPHLSHSEVDATHRRAKKVHTRNQMARTRDPEIQQDLSSISQAEALEHCVVMIRAASMWMSNVHELSLHFLISAPHLKFDSNVQRQQMLSYLTQTDIAIRSSEALLKYALERFDSNSQRQQMLSSLAQAHREITTSQIYFERIPEPDISDALAPSAQQQNAIKLFWLDQVLLWLEWLWTTFHSDIELISTADIITSALDRLSTLPNTQDGIASSTVLQMYSVSMWFKLGHSALNTAEARLQHTLRFSASSQAPLRAFSKTTISIDNFDKQIREAAQTLVARERTARDHPVPNGLSSPSSLARTNSASNSASNRVSNYASNYVSNNVSNHASNCVSNHASNRVSNRVSNRISNRVSNHVSNRISNRAYGYKRVKHPLTRFGALKTATGTSNGYKLPPNASKALHQLWACSPAEASSLVFKAIIGLPYSSNRSYLSRCECVSASSIENEFGYYSVGLPSGGTQSIHRVVIRAFGTEEQQDQMFNGDEVSHLCHQSRCFLYSHLTVESKQDNERRKKCARIMSCICFLAISCIFG